MLIDVRNRKIRAKGKESAVRRTEGLAFQILELTSCQNLDELEKVFPIVLATVRSIPNTEELEKLLAEAIRFLLNCFGIDGDIPVCGTLEEFGIMITESAQRWRNNLIQQGYDTGFDTGSQRKQDEVLEALSQRVISKLENRFGPLPEALKADIKAVPSWDTLGELLCWTVQANSLDDFSSRMHTV